MELRPLPLSLLIVTAVLVLGLRQDTHGAEPPASAASASVPTNVPKTAAKADPDDEASFLEDVVPFLSKHCYSCHGNGKRRADLALDEFREENAIEKDREFWEVVLEMVRSGEMPPKPRPRPSVPETEAAMVALDSLLAKFDSSGPRNAGRVTLPAQPRRVQQHHPRPGRRGLQAGR